MSTNASPSWPGRCMTARTIPAGIVRQMHAISASGDRTSALRQLAVPTTVLHGSADPLARPSAGRATAERDPRRPPTIFEGMGHDLPRALWPTFVEEIAATAARARGLGGRR